MKITDNVKRVLALVVVIVFIIAAALPLTSILVNATNVSDLEQQIKDSQSKKENIRNDIESSKSQKNSLLDEIRAFDAQIEILKNEIEEMNKKITQDDAVIEEVQKKLDEAIIMADNQYEAYKERIRVMYENGSSNYFEILLKADSFSDFLNKYEIVKQISEYDSNMLDKLNKTRQEIEDNKAQLEAVKAEKVEKVNALNVSKQNVEAKSREKDAMVARLDNDIKSLENKLAQQDAEENAIRAQIARLQGKDTTYSGGSMVWPTPSSRNITSPYGTRFHPVLKYNRFHAGVDIGAGMGASVLAANSGKVITATYSSSYGNYVVIDHGGGISTLYAHGSQLLTSVGATVYAGQEIMKVGSTGISTGPHLHFEVLVNGKNTDPMGYF